MCVGEITSGLASHRARRDLVRAEGSVLSRRGGPVIFASASHGGGLRLVSAGHPHHTEEKEI